MQKQQWKQSAIQKSGIISDAWDVFISYAGRAAGWILFGCMACNIIQVLPGITIPPAVLNGVMGVEIITLDIAGFGLNTIAKTISKHGDVEAKAVAHGARRLAICLISLMILTLVLISIGWMFPTLLTITDMANKVLILGRVVMIVIYMHTMHSLREAETEMQTSALQTQQANDHLALENKQQIESADKKIDTVYTLLGNIQEACTNQEKHIHHLEAYIQTLENHIQNTSTAIDTTIDNRINELSTSVTEIHNNVLQITQNNHVYSGVHTPYTTPARDEIGAYSVDEVAAHPHEIEQSKSVVVPALEVPGMAHEKVMEVLTFVLSGSSWTKASKDLNLNYSRIIKPIKEAYEQYLETSVHPL